MIQVTDVLLALDGGRYKSLLNAVEVKEVCTQCAFFNLSLPKTQQYRCRCAPSCIAATLHPDIILHFNKVLGWQVPMKETV